ncbi:hypothetical protein E2C01_051861 [Portunus trituberculatus]|uniref:Uncharacterized protein n=1 Tax=Portunus trituberculatus TaxID=210409 RepID=A0A5B7GCX4_PORTR|nr:hypothetical protein [Portunus trituberculatus]
MSAAHHLYTDGSLQLDGDADGVVFSPDLPPPPRVGSFLTAWERKPSVPLIAVMDVLMSTRHATVLINFLVTAVNTCIDELLLPPFLLMKDCTPLEPHASRGRRKGRER